MGLYDIFYNQIQRQSIDMQSASSCVHNKQEEAQVAGFILKTFEILNVQEYQKIIYWGSNGSQFVIKDIAKFQQIVLPHYFRHNKINSFVRQLNMYGFHKIKHNHFKSTFRHQYFQKGRHDLLALIRRKPKFNDKEAEETQITTTNTPIPITQKPVVSIPAKQEDHYPVLNQKWADITQQFLQTTKMINLSLVKVTLNEMSQPDNLFKVEDDCVSIEDGLQDDMRQNSPVFQNPTMFLAWQFSP